ncbi:MAG: PAS domain-containing protein [Chloroflexi bacterium]|nr:PAS domain-containing protein [Chloroflexota bacterium]MBT7081322.1 PAS domain-containing protein [Chloroflexota bacterium]MBT7290490.1 PAS domain-containing protein [Chloroflexota bacterium]
MMSDQTYTAILDTINHPIVFVDNDHVIRFLNKAAIEHYYGLRGYSDLIGKSLLDCHNQKSKEQIIAYHDRLKAGEDEIVRPIVPKRKKKITVVAVRDSSGVLLGYYERFEQIT